MRDAFLSWDEEFVLDVTVRYWEARAQGRPAGRRRLRRVLPRGRMDGPAAPPEGGRHLRAADAARRQAASTWPTRRASSPTSAPPPAATRELTPLLRVIDEIEGTQPTPSASPTAASDRRRRCRASTAPCRSSRGDTLALPPGAARHVQVLRMQPGDAITLFDGARRRVRGHRRAHGPQRRRGAWSARTTPVEREAPRAVHLAVGMPANERMDWLVEKATELGVASIQPLMTAHGVLRLAGERADKKRAHWEADRRRGLRAVRAQPRAGDPSGAAAGRLARGAGRRAARRALHPEPGRRHARRRRAAAPDRRAAPGAERPRRRPERRPRKQEAHRAAASRRSRSARACCAPKPRRWPRWSSLARPASLDRAMAERVSVPPRPQHALALSRLAPPARLAPCAAALRCRRCARPRRLERRGRADARRRCSPAVDQAYTQLMARPPSRKLLDAVKADHDALGRRPEDADRDRGAALQGAEARRGLPRAHEGAGPGRREDRRRRQRDRPAQGHRQRPEAARSRRTWTPCSRPAPT